MFARVCREARPFRVRLALVVALNLAGVLLLLLSPLPLKIAVDSVLGSRPLPGPLAAVVPAGLRSAPFEVLVLAVVFQVVLAAVTQLQAALASMLGAEVSARLTARFRSRLVARAQRLSFAFHDGRGTGDAIYRIQTDAAAVQSVVIGAIGIATSITVIAGVVVALVLIDVQLAAIALAVAPFLTGYAWVYSRAMRPRHGSQKALESGALAVVHETLGALRVAKAFASERCQQAKFDERNARSVRSQIRIAWAEAGFGALVNLTIAAGSGALLYVGVRRVEANELTLGALKALVA